MSRCSCMREAMTRALRVKWVREGKDEVVAEFPEGWTADRPESGPIELRDPSGVLRALFGWAKDAELQAPATFSNRVTGKTGRTD